MREERRELSGLHTGNEVGAEGATKLAEALPCLSSLQQLYLGGKEGSVRGERGRRGERSWGGKRGAGY